MSIADELRAMGDGRYREFNARLVPNVDASTMVGIRIPRLRDYAKRLVRRDGGTAAMAFMSRLPHDLFEENMLHGILIGLTARSQPQARAMLDRFLPFVDNWEVCDAIRARALMDDPGATWRAIVDWAGSGHPYTVRFAVDELMIDYLGERFRPEHLTFVAGIAVNDYYVNMSRAWYFATALTVQWDAAVRMFEPDPPAAIDDWTYNMSIRKARESRRISPERKALLAASRRPAGGAARTTGTVSGSA